MDSLSAVIGRRVAVAVAAVALVVAACTSAGASADEPIRVGVNLWVGYDLFTLVPSGSMITTTDRRLCKSIPT